MGLPQIPVPTLDTARKPEKLYEFLRLFSDAVRKLNINTEQAPVVFRLTTDMIVTIRDMLQVDGVAPLNVDGLIGLLSQPQSAAIVVASALPDAANYMPGTMLVLTGSPDTFYYNKSGNPNTWQSISTTPTNMMTLDTAQVVTATGTKTVQATWLFEVAQNIINALDANLILTVQDTNAAGTAAAGVVRARGDTSNLSMIGHGTGRVLTRCGITMGGWNELFGAAGSGLLIDITGNFPMVLGTNGAERMRLLGAGGAAGLTLTVGQLIQMVGAIGAGTTQFEIKKSTADGGASIFKIDYEGDVTANDVTIRDLIQTNGSVAANSTGTSFDVDGLTGVGATAIFRTLFGGAAVMSVDGTGRIGHNGDLVTGGNANILGNTDLDGTLNVDGTSRLRGAVTVDTSINVGTGTTITKIVAYSPSLTPAAVAANTTAEQTFTVNGLTTSDCVTFPNKPTAQAGLGIVGVRVSAADTLAITFSNNTAGSITPTAAETYKFLAFRS